MAQRLLVELSQPQPTQRDQGKFFCSVRSVSDFTSALRRLTLQAERDARNMHCKSIRQISFKTQCWFHYHRLLADALKRMVMCHSPTKAPCGLKMKSSVTLET